MGNRWSKFSINSFLIYPFISILKNPVKFVLSFVHIFKAVVTDFRYFRMFDAEKALNNYWYDTMAHNLYSHGRNAKINNISQEPYLIGSWFHISKFSLIPFWQSSVITICLSWLTIVLLNFVFIGSTSFWWIVLISCVLCVGSNFYSQILLQNYNIVGWGFFPLFLWALELNNQALICVLITIFFATSLTVYVIGSFYFVVFAVLENNVTPQLVWVFIPSLILLIFRVYPLYRNGLLKIRVWSVAASIGLINSRQIKYSRKSDRTLSMGTIYKTVTYAAFVLLVFALGEGAPYFLIGALIFLILNEFIARFADKQSIDMLMLICSMNFMAQEQNFLILGLFWLTVGNPIPYLFGSHVLGKKSELKILKPFDVRPLQEGFSRFYNLLESKSRVYISFENPDGDYHKIFDGFRHLMEPAHYYANTSGFLIFPHFWSVFDLNYIGSPEIWGRDLEAINTNMKYWSMNYLIYYTVNKESIPENIMVEFDILAELDWNEFVTPEQLTGVNDLPIWHLMKKRV